MKQKKIRLLLPFAAVCIASTASIPVSAQNAPKGDLKPSLNSKDETFSLVKVSDVHYSNEPSEISIDPEGTLWTATGAGQLYRAGSLVAKTNGDIISKILFFGDSLGLVGTNDGWAYILRTDGKILWKGEIAKGSSFPYSPVKTKSGVAIVSRNASVFDFSCSGKYLGERREIVEDRHQLFGETISAPNTFDDGTVITSISATDNTGKTFYRIRLINPGGKTMETMADDAVKHTAGISTNGKLAILFGIHGAVRVLDGEGNEKRRTSIPFIQVGDFAKLHRGKDVFVASCFDKIKHANCLIAIDEEGRISAPVYLQSPPSSDFCIFQHPTTGQPAIAAGFEDGTIRCIEPKTGAVINEWDDQTGVATITPPIFSKSRLIVIRDLDVVTLMFQNKHGQ